MAKKYQVTAGVRFFNRLMQMLIRLGLAPRGMYLLTVKGRKTGQPYSTPVTLIEEAGKRWLVSPYGEVSWVRNARAAGYVSLRRGRRAETVEIIEVEPEESGPVLKKYLKREPITRPYFEVQVDSPLEAFMAEAARHPVFRIGARIDP